VALLLAAFSTPPEASRDTLAALFTDDLTVVDLTHAVSADAPFWPGPDRSPFVHDTLGAHPDGAPPIKIEGGSGGQVRVFAVVP
jgi:kynurenine formamidase